MTLTLSAVLALTACDTIQETFDAENAINYKSTVTADPLSLPPGMSSSQIQPVYVMPKNATYNEYQALQNQQAKVGSRVAVLPEIKGMKIERQGDRRVLVVDADADTVYPKVESFWTSEGFTIAKNQPEAGILVTDWAENKAGINPGFIQRALGFLGSAMADSGIRDRFTTRFERDGGKTRVYVSHERREEKDVSRLKNDVEFKWVPVDEDQNLNAQVLTQLMVYLGENREAAKAKMQAAEQSATSATNHAVSPSEATLNGDVLVLHHNVKDSFAAVKQALTNAGFTIDSADEQAGAIVVRYLDTDNGKKRKDGNAILRLFGSDGNVKPLPYTLNFKELATNETSVTISADKEDDVLTKRRILTVVLEKLGVR
ncbi:hypothetical protein IX83_06080 [Basilea psittacipulmonis DSM 24701]|uniref:Lipoprotein n=1 Tax=Basilea psittacipulmonis DSM 24701 TaxID=1072685 RepID=A0A077DIE0_9BURK|nr:hypothetical protein IX83_06080 [Basilea psittacipulmonis DSM 24701]